MPRDLRETAQFKSDKKRVKKSGRHDWEKLRSLVALLINDQPLPAKNRDHNSVASMPACANVMLSLEGLIQRPVRGQLDEAQTKQQRERGQTATQGMLFPCPAGR